MVNIFGVVLITLGLLGAEVKPLIAFLMILGGMGVIYLNERTKDEK